MQIKEFQGSLGRCVAMVKRAVLAGTVAITLTGSLALAPAASVAGDFEILGPLLIKNKNIDTSRAEAAQEPRSESDQALAGGWPLYRSDRSQEAFNDVMATLKATDGKAPGASAFKGCADLMCNLTLPAIGAEGWIPPGRIWISPKEYVLIAHSPRLPEGRSYNRRSFSSMRLFVLHEFQNSNGNTDLYDTLSSHSRSVFVPLYMSKQATDAQGRRFVTVVQVAPYDVVSRHASNRGSAGPGMEVSKNTADSLEPLQALAGILVTTIIKTAAPHLNVVHHRNVEGRPMLDAYDRRLAILKGRPDAATVALPFVPAKPQQVAEATANLDQLIAQPGASTSVAAAERGNARAFAVASAGSLPAPTLIGPIRLAIRLRTPSLPKLVGPITLAIRPAAPTRNTIDR